MISFHVTGMGVCGPGFSGRCAFEQVLARDPAALPAATEIDRPEMLSSRERRRASPPVRLALNAASEAVRDSGRSPAELPMVFASSLGDGTILNSLLEVLADPAGQVSPTHFHNSVHNAAMAYWSIGTGCRLPGTSIAAHDFTFGAALLKSAAQMKADDCEILLVVYDHPFPEPLNQARPLVAPFAAAFVLSPVASNEGPLVHLSLPGPPLMRATPPRIRAFGDLWRNNPAARALPFLEILMSTTAARIDVAFRPGRNLRLDMSP